MLKFLSFIGRLIKGLFWLTLLVILASLAFLYVAERDLPPSWLGRLNDRLSNDQVSVQIGRASYGLRRGLVFHRIRAFAKGSVDHAFASVDEAILSLTLRPRRPYVEWIDALSLRNLRCNDLPDELLNPPPSADGGAADRTMLSNLDLTDVALSIAGADVAGMSFERVSGRLAAAHGTFHFSNAQVVWPAERWPESVHGEVTFRPSESRIEGRLAGRTTPKRLRPLLERLHARSVVRIGDKFTFTTDPVEAQCTFLVAPQAQRYELMVDVTVRNVTYNGVPVREASTVIKGSGPETLSLVVISPIVVACDAGKAQATLVYDGTTDTLEIDAQGEMAVGPLTQIIEVLNEGELSGVTFDHAPRLTIKGRVGVASNNPAPNDLTGTLSASAASLYGQPLRDLSFTYSVRPDDVVAFTSFTGVTPARGRIAGDFSLLPRRAGTNASFRTALRLTDVPATELWAAFGSTNGPAGRIRASVEMTGRFAPDQQGQPASPGHFRVSECVFNVTDGNALGMAFDRVSGRLIVADDATRLKDVKIAWPAGRWPETAEGELTIAAADGRIEGHVTGRTTPERLRPLFACLQAQSLVAIGDRLGFTNEPAAAQCTFRVGPSSGSYELRVDVAARDITYNKVPVRSVHTVIAASGAATGDRVVLDPLDVETDTGSSHAALVHDAATDTLHVDADIGMPLDPLMRIIGILNNGELAGLQIGSTSRLTARGLVSLSDRSAATTDLRGTLSAPDADVYGLPLRNVSCGYRVGWNNATTITNLMATTPAGGQIAGEFAVAPGPGGSNTAYRTVFDVTAMDLAELSASFGASNRPPGKVSAHIDLNGYLGVARIRHPTGQGRIAITEGAISRIPLFAGFTSYLARNVPGVETLVNQSNGSFDFTATNGLVSSSNVLIEGEVFSLSGKGQYAIPEDRLDFLVQAGIFKRGSLLGKVTRMLTLPFSKLLLEFRVKGSAANPTWEYLGILQRIAETVTDAISPSEESNPNP